MELVNTVLITVFTLALLVTVHEYGHFWVARRCGVKVLKFSIGFGRSLYSWRDRTGTEYVIALIPLGGYVKMLDQREAEVEQTELDQAFNRKTVLQRIAIVAAGPLANFVLAIFAYWMIFISGETGIAPILGEVEVGSVAEVAGLESGQEIVALDGSLTPTTQALSFSLLDRIGDSGPIYFSVRYPGSDVVYESRGELKNWLSDQEQPDLFGGLGITMYRPKIAPVIDEVVLGSAAEKASLVSGDQILNADGFKMDEWTDWVEYVRARAEQPISILVKRQEELLQLQITPAKKLSKDGEIYGQVGVSVVIPEWPSYMIRELEYNPGSALFAAIQRTGELSIFTLTSIKKMFMGIISPKNLSGPITIAKVASASAKSGIESYVGFLALLSISLGVLNLLPIPILDGGHLLFYAIEWLVGRPVPEKIQVIGYQMGLFIILGVMALALYNDFARL